MTPWHRLRGQVRLENNDKCKCGESYAVFAFTRAEKGQSEATHRWPDDYLGVWGGRVRAAQAALNARFGQGRVHTYMDDVIVPKKGEDETEAETDAREAATLKNAKRAHAFKTKIGDAETNPCLEVFVFYGHGTPFGGISLFDNGYHPASETRGPLFGGNGLSLIALFSCDMDAKEWAGYTQSGSTDDVVTYTVPDETTEAEDDQRPGSLATEATPDQREAHQDKIIGRINEGAPRSAGTGSGG